MTTEELRLNVEKALDEIRPFLQSDGGNISLISIENDTLVKVQLEGACVDDDEDGVRKGLTTTGAMNGVTS